jgi:hypothetical protein
MTSARRSAGLRRVSTATFGLVAASVTGAAVVTGVVAHQGIHHDVPGTSTLTGSNAQTDDQQPVQQQPAQESPVQVLPGGPAPAVGAVQQRTHHAVTSGS